MSPETEGLDLDLEAAGLDLEAAGVDLEAQALDFEAQALDLCFLLFYKFKKLQEGLNLELKLGAWILKLNPWIFDFH